MILERRPLMRGTPRLMNRGMNARDTEILRIAVLLRDDSTCVYCGTTRGAVRFVDGRKTLVKVTVDHILPRSWGGRDTPKNLVCACDRCNTMKATMDDETFAFMLKRMGLIKTRSELTDRVKVAIAKRLDRKRAARIYTQLNRKK